jgi:arabinogalactan endo-1,4-beta-galactosidase
MATVIINHKIMKSLKEIFTLLSLSLLLSTCQKDASTPQSTKPDFIRAADLSFLPAIEQSGTRYTDENGANIDVLTFFKKKGCNTVRLRLWHQPLDAHSSLAEVAALATRVHQAGMNVWLDIHYSDSWADPGAQTLPSAWSKLSLTPLTDSVYAYTRRVLARGQPDIVQIGNEINDGFLWPTGKSSNSTAFLQLLQTGIKAARDHSKSLKVMIHYAGTDGANAFFERLTKNGTDFDWIGISYYPWWHGKDLDLLQNTLNTLGTTYNKPVVIAETAYPFTLAWNDYTNNVVGLDNQLLAGFSATREGQLQYLLRLKTILQSIPSGQGFCYWGAEWVAFKGKTATDGSSWENLALFGFSNQALPAFDVFKE